MQSSKTYSISSLSDKDCKQIDMNVKNLAKVFNLSQYDEIMEQGLGVVKKLSDTLFNADDTTSEVNVIQEEVASQNLDKRYFKDKSSNNLSHTLKKEKFKRKVFQTTKRRIIKKNDFDNKIRKIIADKRDNTTEEKVKKLRHAINNQKFYYDRQKKVFKLIMPFHLKYLSVPKAQNPIRSCRFFEYVFPFDAKLYCFEPENTRQLHENYNMFKRIYGMENNTQKKQIKYLIEERDPSLVGKNHEGILKIFSYFCDWLESLNNAKAKFLRDALIQHKLKMHEYINNMMEVNSCSIVNHGSQKNPEKNIMFVKKAKTWIKKIDSNTKKWMKQRPFIVKIMSTSQETEVTEVNCYYLSYNMFLFLGQTPNVEDNCACFNVLEGLNTTDFTKYFMDQGEQDWDVPNIAKPDKQFNNNTSIKYGKKSKKIESCIIFYEKWIFNDYFYRKTYLVMYK